MKIAVRGFVEGRRFKIFEERLNLPEAKLKKLLPKIAEDHAKLMVGRGPHMIEIEFLEELDPDGRFFRFGTDPRGMVHPFALKFPRT